MARASWRLVIPEGSSVELEGGGLLGGTYGVTMDGTPVTYTAYSPNYMVITTPAHAAGEVQVQINAAGGSSVATEASAYTYLVPASYNSLRGTDRYDTAIKISKAMFPGALPPGSGVVLAPGETFQEALCGAPLAAAYGGPVLLTTRPAWQERQAETATPGALLRLLHRARRRHRGRGQAALPSATVTTINGAAPANVYDMSRKVAKPSRPSSWT